MKAVNRPLRPKQPRRMRTLGDAVASIVFEWSQLPPKQRNKMYQYEYSLRTSAYAASMVLSSTDDWASISLHKLMGLNSQLIDLALSEGFDRRHASCYATDVRKILAHAAARGWTCREMEVLKSWELPTAALRGQTFGCLQIIEYLISKRKTPAKTREKDLDSWRQLAQAGGLAISAAEEYLMRFRGKMRAPNLAKMFPNLDLRSKTRERYGDALEVMTLRTRTELETIVKFKTAVWLPGRNARVATRAPSINKLYKSVRQLHGHRTQIQKKKPVAGLIHLITPANIYPFVDFLEHDHGLLRDGVRRAMAPIQTMVQQHPMFKGRNYDWIFKRIRKVPKERHYKIVMRKEEKAQPYELLGQIPNALRRESEIPGLSDFDVACCRHDEALWDPLESTCRHASLSIL